MKAIKFKIEGTQPLMLNNAQTVNPFNKYTLALKPLTAKRKKTEDDMNEIYRLQFESSLYIKDGKYIIPCDCFWQSVCSAAKEQRLGTKFERSFLVPNDCLLDFPEKDMTPKQLFDARTHVDIRDGVIQRSRIPVCRAIFPEWKTEVECYYDETQLDEKDILNIIQIAGLRYGVGTYRKKYGRYKPTKI